MNDPRDGQLTGAALVVSEAPIDIAAHERRTRGENGNYGGHGAVGPS